MLSPPSAHTQVQRSADAPRVFRGRTAGKRPAGFNAWPISTTRRLFVGLMRALLALLCFVGALAAEEDTAQAAQIAMCSELGESIAAPPPLYAAKDIRIQGCDSEEMEEWQVPEHGRLPSQLNTPERELEKSLVLPTEFVVASETSSARRSFDAEDSILEEHRARLQRPPRA